MALVFIHKYILPVSSKPDILRPFYAAFANHFVTYV